jgi:hypothetical protein
VPTIVEAMLDSVWGGQGAERIEMGEGVGGEGRGGAQTLTEAQQKHKKRKNDGGEGMHRPQGHVTVSTQQHKA